MAAGGAALAGAPKRKGWAAAGAGAAAGAEDPLPNMKVLGTGLAAAGASAWAGPLPKRLGAGAEEVTGAVLKENGLGAAEGSGGERESGTEASLTVHTSNKTSQKGPRNTIS